MTGEQLVLKMAYLDGFLDDSPDSFHKCAGGLPGFSDLASWSGVALDKLRIALMLAPALAGVGAGAVASSMTSPSKLDIANAQRRLLSAELAEQLAQTKRQRLLRKLQEVQNGESGAVVRRDSGNAIRI